MEFPSMTPTWHKASYPAISPTSTSISKAIAGKTVVITGGGVGIGAVTARSFAKAGAAKIALLGRTEKTLVSTKKEIEASHKDVRVSTFVANITDEEDVNAAFASIGQVDILISNAGYASDTVPISGSKLSDWWAGFEINVKGAFIVTQAFLKVAAKDAVLVSVTAALAHMTPWTGHSSYTASKLAAAKLFETVQVENPGLHVVSVHPGVVESSMSLKLAAAHHLPVFDRPELPADFIVWACSPDARFLKGRLVWANWDIEEMKERKAQFEDSTFLTLGLEGFHSFKYTSGNLIKH